ncbi:MAG: hypothetical protein HY922_17400 [Elusimicrobia bacterium]|nr:hypothetical protein [Elusimicrobiota bacterium]
MAPPAFALSLDEVFRRQLTAEERDKSKDMLLDRLASRFNESQKRSVRAELGRWKGSKEIGTLRDAAKGYLALGDSEDALAVAESIKSLYPGQPAGYLLAADASYRLGRYQAAADHAAMALEKNPKDYNALAILRLAQGEGARVPGFAQKHLAPAPGKPAAMPGGERALSAAERRQIEAALMTLARTKSGREILEEAMRKTGGADATVTNLAANGVDVRADDGSDDAFAKVRKDGEMDVVAFPPMVLNHKEAERAAAAAAAGEALGRVAVTRKEGERFSLVLLKEKTVLFALHAYEEIKTTSGG